MQELALVSVVVSVMIGFFTLIALGIGTAVYLYVHSEPKKYRTKRRHLKCKHSANKSEQSLAPLSNVFHINPTSTSSSDRCKHGFNQSIGNGNHHNAQIHELKNNNNGNGNSNNNGNHHNAENHELKNNNNGNGNYKLDKDLNGNSPKQSAFNLNKCHALKPVISLINNTIEKLVDEVKVEEVKVEEVKLDEVKVEPKIEEVKIEEVKVEEPKFEEVKEESKVFESNIEELKAEDEVVNDISDIRNV